MKGDAPVFTAYYSKVLLLSVIVPCYAWPSRSPAARRGRTNYAQIPTFFVRITKSGRCGTILTMSSLRTAAMYLM